ncbi:MAG TPA: hypothetical protein VNO26_13480, partial [Candidatus Limnocylindria bacterium]|nr:hypothetical protein [Candidatus Limnocylindria bacterium]
MRILRRVVVVAGFVLGTMGLALVALLAALHTDPGRAVVRERLQHLLSTALAGRVTLGALETPRPGTIVLRDVVASMPERGVVRASRIELALGLPLPVPPTLRLRHVRVDGLVAHLRDVGPARDRDDRDGGGITVAADDLRITAGRLAMRLDADVGERRVVLSPISLRASLSAGPAGLRLAVASLEATPRGLPLAPIDAALTLRVAADGGIELPSFALTSSGTRLSGTGTLDASRVVDAHLSADPLAPAALAPLVPGLVLPPGSTARLALRGSPAGLRASAQVDLGAAGRIAARARVDASGELPVYRATLAVQELVP